MALCDNCLFYKKEQDEFRQNYDDVVVIDSKEKPHHYCPMYNDHIPQEIWYNNGNCPYYEKKE